ncbi:MAG: Fe-S cluster assembly protein SufD [Parvibaculum sp.]|nr:Fe-S cluster assembly protein SufD [Parvibaculum sp.]
MGDAISTGSLLETATGRNTGAADWAEALRDRSRAEFAALGLPNRRLEAWRYSDLARALSETVRETGSLPTCHDMPGAYSAIFENGILDETQSSFREAGALPLRQILADPASPFVGHIGGVNPQDDHPLLSLNTALMEEGIVLRVPAGTTLEQPLHLRFDWQADTIGGRHLRVLILLEEGAKATLVETHGGSPSFATIVTEVRLAKNSELTHVRLERLGSSGRQSAMTLGEIGASARYRAFYLSEGGHFSRHEALLKLAGEEAQADIEGASLATGTRHCDNTTIITHAVPHTTSQQSFRGVLSGRARGAYQGCIRVAPDAQGTDARQMSRALLLSHRAEAATKPELEIFADDVKCAHGATIGELDADALFFLRARGIPEAEALSILIEAFFSESLAMIENDHLRGLATDAVQDWLSSHASEVSSVE